MPLFFDTIFFHVKCFLGIKHRYIAISTHFLDFFRFLYFFAFCASSYRLLRNTNNDDRTCPTSDTFRLTVRIQRGLGHLVFAVQVQLRLHLDR